MKNNLRDKPILKLSEHIVITSGTRERLEKIGSMGESFNYVINKILDEREKKNERD